ncbi:MAG: GerMN domain-containing protein [Cyanobacteria bacterium J06621_11]
MSTHHVIDFPKKPNQFRRFLRIAAASILASGSAVGLYWQGVYVPRQRSEAIVVQLEELTDSLERLEAGLQSSSANLPKDESPTNATEKVMERRPESYWLTVSGAEISLAPQPLNIDADAAPDVVLETALETLLIGPKQGRGNVTSIPAGTRLLNLEVLPRGIYVDLSNEFSQGGGSSSMTTRVAQILYTATSLEPEAGVFLSIEGQPLNETYPLGGEGLVLSQPLTRGQFVKDFPPNLLKSTED